MLFVDRDPHHLAPIEWAGPQEIDLCLAAEMEAVSPHIQESEGGQKSKENTCGSLIEIQPSCQCGTRRRLLLERSEDTGIIGCYDRSLIGPGEKQVQMWRSSVVGVSYRAILAPIH
jgi:hypothetical protein